MVSSILGVVATVVVVVLVVISVNKVTKKTVLLTMASTTPNDAVTTKEIVNEVIRGIIAMLVSVGSMYIIAYVPTVPQAIPGMVLGGVIEFYFHHQSGLTT